MIHKNIFLLMISLCLLTSFFSCKLQTITVRQEGKLSERYQVIRKSKEKHGFHKVFYPNRKVAIEETYVKGQLDGPVYTYYENGQLESVVQTKAGTFDGDFIYYYEDGTIKQTGEYKDDKIVGQLYTYYANGQLKEMVTMENSDENGPFREYAKDGVLTAQGHYVSLGERTALEQGLLYVYDPQSRKLLKKMRCRQGFCCTIWSAQKGYMFPTNDLCKDIINQQNEIQLTD